MSIILKFINFCNCKNELWYSIDDIFSSIYIIDINHLILLVSGEIIFLQWNPIDQKRPKSDMKIGDFCQNIDPFKIDHPTVHWV